LKRLLFLVVAFVATVFLVGVFLTSQQTLPLDPSKLKVNVDLHHLQPKSPSDVPSYMREAVGKLKVEIRNPEETYTRKVDLSSKWVHIFHYGKVARKPGSEPVEVLIVGVEDLPEGWNPDGWSDVIIVCTRDRTSNHEFNVPSSHWLYYYDITFTGSFHKTLYFENIPVIRYRPGGPNFAWIVWDETSNELLKVEVS